MEAQTRRAAEDTFENFAEVCSYGDEEMEQGYVEAGEAAEHRIYMSAEKDALRACCLLQQVERLRDKVTAEIEGPAQSYSAQQSKAAGILFWRVA